MTSASHALAVRRLLDLSAAFAEGGGVVASLLSDRPALAARQRRARRFAAARSLRGATSWMLAPEPLDPREHDLGIVIDSVIHHLECGAHTLVATRRDRVVGAATVSVRRDGDVALDWLGTAPGHYGAGAALVAAAASSHTGAEGDFGLYAIPRVRGYYERLGFVTEPGGRRMVLPAPVLGALRAALPAMLSSLGEGLD